MNRTFSNLLDALKRAAAEKADSHAGNMSAFELEARVLYSATPLDFADHQPEPIDIADAFAEEPADLEVAAMSATLPTYEFLISNLGNSVTGDGDSWEASELERFGDPDLALGPVTDGTFSAAFDLSPFASNNVFLRDAHSIQHDITLGSGADSFDLEVGDILFSVDGGGTLSGTTTTIDAELDVYVFRPDHVGVFDQGEFFYLMDNPYPDLLGGITLIDKPGGITLSDGTAIAEGTVVTASTIPFLGIYLSTHEPTGVGQGTSTGDLNPFFKAGSSFGINQSISGLHIVQDSMTVGGIDLFEGDILFSLTATDTSVGSNGVSIAAEDVGLLRFSGGSWQTTKLVDGSDVGLGGGNERIDAITIGLANTAPTSISIDNASIDESLDTSSGLVVGSLSALDHENNPLDFSVVGASPFSIVGNDLVLTGVNLDFESTPSYTVRVRATDPGNLRVESDLTILVNDLNEAPSVSLQNLLPNVFENTMSQTKVADIVVTDDALGNETFSLTGANAGMFQIVGFELFLRANSGVNFEADSQLEVTVRVDDATIGSTFDDSTSHTFAVTDVNEAPSFSLTNPVIGMPEDTDTSTRKKMADIVIIDDALGNETFSISGSDAPLFEVIGTELFLVANAPLDFETNASLDIVLELDDATIGTTFEDSALFSTQLSDANDAPSVTLTNQVTTIPEGATTQTKVADINVEDDALGTETLSLVGVDSGLFEIIGTEVFLIAGLNLDFETQNSLRVAVQVDDATLGSTAEDLAEFNIAVQDVNEAPTVTLQNLTASTPENNTTQVKIADIVVTDDALGTEVLNLTGANSFMFEIVGTELFLKANSGADFEFDTELEVTVQVDDYAIGSFTVEDTAELTLEITNVNEAPSVAFANLNVSIDEDFDTTSPTKVADILVFDDDSLINETITLVGADKDLFVQVGSELFLVANAVLDFETNPVLDVTAQVDDPSLGTSFEDTAIFSMAVNDVNEAPTVSVANAIPSVPEDTTTQTKIADIVVADDALGSEALSLSGIDAGLFEIIGMELFLRPGASLDFETNPTLNVTVEVDDTTLGSGIDNSIDFLLDVTDVNEEPTITLANTVASIPEDTTAQTKIADIVVTDDALGNETLSLSGTDAGLFEIIGAELFLRSDASLDFETNPTLDVTVEVDDPTLGTVSEDSVSYSLDVTDVNEAPSIELLNTVTTLPENYDTSSPAKVADIVVTDDALGTETLILVGPDASMFEIVGNELFIAAGESLDFETNPSLFVIVRVDDPSISNTFEDNVALTIAITDVNEAPSVALTNTVDTLPEDLDTSTRTKIADIVVTDDALGTNRLSDEGPDQGLFEIVNNKLFLRAGVTLDFETKDTLRVFVQVEDDVLGERERVLHTITISDVNEAPTVTLLNTVSAIDENTGLLNRLKVSDIQIDDDAIGSESLTLNGDDSNLFEIVGSELFLKAGSDLDFETNPVLDVTVEVDDPSLGVSFEDSAVHAINITDVNEAPSVQLTNRVTQIDENTTVQTKIADIVVTDDALGSETLTVSGGDADLFEIIGTELFLKAGQTIDFESRTVLSVTVEIDDPTLGFSNDDVDFFDIDVNDVNEAPTVVLTNTVGSIDENTDTSVPIKIADIVVHDDALGNENLIVAGADAADFEIVGNELYLRAGTTLDFESKSSFDVTVEVDDPTLGFTSEDFATHTLSVADINEAPSISLTNTVLSLPENTDTTAAIKVADIQITDDALGFETLSTSGTNGDLFEVVGTELFLKANVDLDFESLSQLNVTISVDDAAIGAVAEDSIDFILDVLDVNEVPSVTLINKLASVPEDTIGQTKVADIIVSDDALGSEDLTLSGLDAGLFEIVGFELFLRANPGLDFESDVDLDVSVSVDDPTVGSTPDSTDSMLIDVTDVNEAPTITLVNTTTKLGENADTSTRTKIADIHSADDALGTISFILDGPDNALFEIVGTELFLKAGVSLDFETQNQLDISVLVDDPTLGTTFEDTDSLSISITDVNEAPAVTLINQVASVLENTTTQTKVAEILVSDDALGSESLSLVGSDQNNFEIIGNELFLKANQNVDFETNSKLNVAVVVDDPALGSGPEDQADFELDVIDVNELPSVTLINQISSLPENFDTSAQTKIADIEITDDALGDETLSLSGTDSNDFEIIGTELFLKQGVVLDFETQNMLDVVVEVDDATLGSGSDDSTSHSLEVTDVNEAPTVSLTNTVNWLPEDFDTTTSTRIADIVVSDDALGSETLSLSGSDSDLFEIVGNELYLKSGVVLDFESLSSLEVRVEVDDASIGTGSEDVAAHTIQIVDINEAPVVAFVNKLDAIPEDTTTRTKIADIVVNDDALGIETLSLSGADAGLFEIVGTELFLLANPGLDHETAPLLDVSVSVEDAEIGAVDIDSHSLAVTDVNEAPVVVNPLPSVTATEDYPDLVIDLANVFEDVDLDTLDLNVASISDSSIASILIAGNSLVIDFVDNQSGSFTVDIVADDGEFTATDTFTVVVAPANDAPVLDGDASLASIYQDSNPAGETVRDVVNSLFSDIDGDSLGGIAITENGTTISEGRWQYFDTTGNSWQDIGLANQSAAVALTADTIIRFLPASEFIGSPTPIEFIAIDSTYVGSFSDESIAHIDVATSGDTTPYSSDFSELGIQVLPFGISVNRTSPTITSESGDNATFEVFLDGAPTGDVIVTVASNDLMEGTTSTNELVFTAVDWFVPQTVEVFAVDDDVQDGDQNYSIVLGPAASSDVQYDALNAEDLEFVNFDDDVAGVLVSESSLLTSENGLVDDFDIVLTSQPTDVVRIEIAASEPGEAILSRSFIEFTPGNWSVAQTITVAGNNDLIADGDTQFSLSLTSTSIGDNNFDSVLPSSIAVTNLSAVGPVIVTPEPESKDEDDEKITGPTVNDIRQDDATTVDEVTEEKDEFIPVTTREAGANDIARTSRLLDYADTGLSTEVNIADQFNSRNFYREIDANEEIYEVYVEAKKISLEAAQLLREDKETDLGNLWGELDSLDDQINQEASMPKIAAGTMASIASIFTAGYLVWLIRGGQLLLGLLSGLPAWTSMDMLAVLSESEEEDEEDSQSLESIVSEPDDSQPQQSQDRRGAALDNNQRKTSSTR